MSCQLSIESKIKDVANLKRFICQTVATDHQGDNGNEQHEHADGEN